MNGVNIPDDFEHGESGIRTYKKTPPQGGGLLRVSYVNRRKNGTTVANR
jgi:hypothetical protein